jgi:hypothetical protein
MKDMKASLRIHYNCVLEGYMQQGKEFESVIDMEGSDNGPELQRRHFETLFKILQVGVYISALVLMLKSEKSDPYIQLDYRGIDAFR